MSGFNVAVAHFRKTQMFVRPTDVFFHPKLPFCEKSLSLAGSSSLVIDHVFLEFSLLGSPKWTCFCRGKRGLLSSFFKVGEVVT